MGCDIHFYVERRDGPESPWVTADRWTDDEYSPGEKAVAYGDSFYNGRSYDLFAILANVRNGRGFAGVKTGEGFVPICEPCGVPDDACAEYLAEVERWGCDGHSHSYHTLAELLAYDWTQVTKHVGVVDLKEWARYKANGKPGCWAGGVSGGSVRHVAEAEVEAARDALGLALWEVIRDEYSAISRLTKKLGGGHVYTKVEWTETYYVSCAGFWSHCVPRLLRLGKPEDVRVVFFFDN